MSFNGDTFVTDGDDLEEIPYGHVEVNLEEADVYVPERVLEEETSSEFRDALDDEHRPVPAADVFPGDEAITRDAVVSIDGKHLVEIWDGGEPDHDEDVIAVMDHAGVLVSTETFAGGFVDDEKEEAITSAGFYFPGDKFFPDDAFVPRDTFFADESFVPGEGFWPEPEDWTPGDPFFARDHFVEPGDDDFPGGVVFSSDAALINGSHGVIQEELVPELDGLRAGFLADGGGVLIGSGGGGGAGKS